MNNAHLTRLFGKLNSVRFPDFLSLPSPLDISQFMGRCPPITFKAKKSQQQEQRCHHDILVLHCVVCLRSCLFCLWSSDSASDFNARKSTIVIEKQTFKKSPRHSGMVVSFREPFPFLGKLILICFTRVMCTYTICCYYMWYCWGMYKRIRCVILAQFS